MIKKKRRSNYFTLCRDQDRNNNLISEGELVEILVILIFGYMSRPKLDHHWKPDFQL